MKSLNFITNIISAVSNEISAIVSNIIFVTMVIIDVSALTTIVAIFIFFHLYKVHLPFLFLL
jgi:hypothetical protein